MYMIIYIKIMGYFHKTIRLFLYTVTSTGKRISKSALELSNQERWLHNHPTSLVTTQPPNLPRDYPTTQPPSWPPNHQTSLVTTQPTNLLRDLTTTQPPSWLHNHPTSRVTSQPPNLPRDYTTTQPSGFFDVMILNQTHLHKI